MPDNTGDIHGPKAIETLARASHEQLLAALEQLDVVSPERKSDQDATENITDSGDWHE